jgi:hypothetical protein
MILMFRSANWNLQNHKRSFTALKELIDPSHHLDALHGLLNVKFLMSQKLLRGSPEIQ